MAKQIKILDRQHYPTGSIVMEQGDEGGRAFIIESGKVEIYILDPEGNKIEISQLGPGCLLGEIALLDDGVRTSTVRATEPTILIGIPSHEFQKACRMFPDLRRTILHMTTERLKETLQAVEAARNPKKIREEAVQAEVLEIIGKLENALQKVMERA